MALGRMAEAMKSVGVIEKSMFGNLGGLGSEYNPGSL
jgi:hypothetical protein